MHLQVDVLTGILDLSKGATSDDIDSYDIDTVTDTALAQPGGRGCRQGTTAVLIVGRQKRPVSDISTCRRLELRRNQHDIDIPFKSGVCEGLFRVFSI